VGSGWPSVSTSALGWTALGAGMGAPMGMADALRRFPPRDDSVPGPWYGCGGGTVALPQHNPPMTLDEAVAELRRDPLHSVHARVDGLEVELRVVAATSARAAEDALARWPVGGRKHGGDLAGHAGIPSG